MQDYVRDVMDEPAATVAWSDTAEAALARMRRLGCDSLGVVDGNSVVGLCRRDDLLRQERAGTWLGALSVGDVARPGPFWCQTEEEVAEALRRMARLGSDTLVVVDGDGRIVGSIVASHLAEQRAVA